MLAKYQLAEAREEEEWGEGKVRDEGQEGRLL